MNTHWKRPRSWEGLKAEGEEGSRGGDGWMAKESEMTEATWQARGVQCVCMVACFVLFQIRDCIACFNAGGNAREEG